MFDMNGIVEAELKIVNGLSQALEGKCDVPEGTSLYVIATKSGGLKYHLREKVGGVRKSRALGGAKSPEVIAIKQQFFNKEFNRRLEHNVKLLNRIKGKFLCYDAEAITDSLPAIYRDEEGIINKVEAYESYWDWQSKDFKSNSLPMQQSTSKAIDGTRMRSKSEVILYNIIAASGLPVKYDVDINLTNEAGDKIYKNADFVFPHKDGGLLILEHLGLLDNPMYLENAMHKIRLYLRNGYTINERLFLTADDADGKINAASAKDLIESMIMPRVLWRC